MTSDPVAVYAIAALACLTAAWRERAWSTRSVARGGPAVWSILAGTLTLMSLGRLLDVGTTATRVARHAVHAAGWYGERRPVQMLVTFGVLVAGGLATIPAIRHLRRQGREVLIAACATGLLVLMSAARLVSLHAVDAALRYGLPLRVSVAGASELALLAVVIGNVVVLLVLMPHRRIGPPPTDDLDSSVVV